MVRFALGIAAKILFFLEKIEAESPALSFLRKGNAQINQNLQFFIEENNLLRLKKTIDIKF